MECNQWVGALQGGAISPASTVARQSGNGRRLSNHRTDEWLSAIRNSVAPRSRLTLDPERAALLVMDMNVYFATPAGRSYLPMTEQIIPNLKLLIDYWRTVGAAVIFTRHGHEGEHDLGMLGRFFSDYIRVDEPESEIIPELSPCDHETSSRRRPMARFGAPPRTTTRRSEEPRGGEGGGWVC